MSNVLIVISGPSGSGKSTVIKNLLARRSNAKQISTYTTRPPREGEKNGEQYNFISKREYLTLLNENKLMACSKIENDFYGMPLLEDRLQEGENIDYLIDMGVSGGLEIKERFPQTIMIYLIPETQEQLLIQRGDRGKTRQARGLKQIEKVTDSKKYKWLVRNGDLDRTLEKVEAIIDYTRKRRLGKLSPEDLVKSKDILTGLILSSAENIEFLRNFYNIERERGMI